jgi:hypothetical protein
VLGSFKLTSMKTNTPSNGVPIGSQYEDMFGAYEVIGEPVWSDDARCYMQDVRGPEGWVTTNAVPALRHYLGLVER